MLKKIKRKLNKQNLLPEKIKPNPDFLMLFKDLQNEMNNISGIWLKYNGLISVLELLQLLIDFHDAKIGYNEFCFEQKLITFLKEKELK